MLSNKTYTTAATETVKSSKAKALSKCGLKPHRKVKFQQVEAPFIPTQGEREQVGATVLWGATWHKNHGVIYTVNEKW